MSENVTAQSPTTAGCRIDVREYGQTYIARAAGLNITASCTCGAKAAAERCADKVFGSGNWEMFASDRCTFIGSRKIRPEDLASAKPAKPASAWRDPAEELPAQCEVVLVRGNGPVPVDTGYLTDDCEWSTDHDSGGIDGWMRLAEAAAILDRATRVEVAS